MKKVVVVIIIAGVFAASGVAARQQLSMTEQEAAWIGERIFHNECGGKIDKLVWWNEGEEFPSLGIGHFIWYTDEKRGPFEESFPKLLNFIKRKGRAWPEWLEGPKVSGCPWMKREDFIRDLDSAQVEGLRRFLVETKDLQLMFIFNRLKSALPKILKAAPEGSRRNVERQFRRMSLSPSGIYALVDYVNFSGEGTSPTERYNGQGWGLLQVLERMKGYEPGVEALREFVASAETVLTERIANSTPERNEQRWLAGWKKRLSTYIDSGVDSSR